MGRLTKKLTAATSGSYISRTRALKRLQITLADFRRLCILKGIYPREPKNKRKLQNGSGALRTYYYTKDIQYLMHEPILGKLREYKIFAKRLSKLVGKRQWTEAAKFEQTKPTYTLDHIVRERYPSFVDALRDLDDCLCMIFLFASLPQTNKVTAEISASCQKLVHHFQYYVMKTNALTKTFLSIKGIYYQAVIQGQTITWIVPYEFAQSIPTDVDFRVMLSFLEFYQTLLGFVNFKLWSDLKLTYPPQINEQLWNDGAGIDSMIITSNQPEQANDAQGKLDGAVALDFELEASQINPMKDLFKSHVFFISRETPRASLEFVIKAAGGTVGWESGAGSLFEESDESITHQITDRPSLTNTFITRSYIQPQWIYDSINAKQVLPVDSYKIGCTLPPHLSPFVAESNPVDESRLVEESVIRKTHDKLIAEEDAEVEDESEKAPIAQKQIKKKKELTDERKQLAMSMMTKKERKLYDQMQHGKKKKDVENKRLEERRNAIKNKKQK